MVANRPLGILASMGTKQVLLLLSYKPSSVKNKRIFRRQILKSQRVWPTLVENYYQGVEESHNQGTDNMWLNSF